ncbi:hypothetical protein DRJ48_05450 [Candidatus Woesearchaeota archaeon]|nr:chemotaxis protein CheC [Candidatus Woesearchaeota archaeon]RLE41495.1 MAG: hypothetical protein DRJ48_05450 [Candidatus Woesearchaeota archaeon]
MVLEQLTEKEKDVIIEIANIGSGNASRALSQLCGCKIEPMKPELLFLSEKEMGKHIDGNQKRIVWGGVDINGNIEGQALFVFEEEHSSRLMRVITKKAEIMALEEMLESGFKEIFNIFTGNYLAAMANLLGIKIMHSLPKLTIGSPRLIIESIFKKRGVDEVIGVKTVIHLEGSDIYGFFMLALDEVNLRKFLSYIERKF